MVLGGALSALGWGRLLLVGPNKVGSAGSVPVLDGGGDVVHTGVPLEPGLDSSTVLLEGADSSLDPSVVTSWLSWDALEQWSLATGLVSLLGVSQTDSSWSRVLNSVTSVDSVAEGSVGSSGAFLWSLDWSSSLATFSVQRFVQSSDASSVVSAKSV